MGQAGPGAQRAIPVVSGQPWAPALVRGTGYRRKTSVLVLPSHVPGRLVTSGVLGADVIW